LLYIEQCHYVHKIGIALSSSRNTKYHSFYGLCLYFLLLEKILILFYQLVNHYTSIYIFPHSPFSLTIFLWNKVLFKKQANHSVSLDKF